MDQEFLFEARDFNMKAFNLTASVSMDHQDGMDETGLLIASRMVDRFQFFEEGKTLRLILTKDKSYPSLSDFPVPDPKPLKSFSVRPPDTEELKLLVRPCAEALRLSRYSAKLQFPGKGCGYGRVRGIPVRYRGGSGRAHRWRNCLALGRDSIGGVVRSLHFGSTGFRNESGSH